MTSRQRGKPMAQSGLNERRHSGVELNVSAGTKMEAYGTIMEESLPLIKYIISLMCLRFDPTNTDSVNPVTEGKQKVNWTP